MRCSSKLTFDPKVVASPPMFALWTKAESGQPSCFLGPPLLQANMLVQLGFGIVFLRGG